MATERDVSGRLGISDAIVVGTWSPFNGRCRVIKKRITRELSKSDIIGDVYVCRSNGAHAEEGGGREKIEPGERATQSIVGTSEKCRSRARNGKSDPARSCFSVPSRKEGYLCNNKAKTLAALRGKITS